MFRNVECTLLRTKTDTYLVLIRYRLLSALTVSYDAVGIDEREKERVMVRAMERLTHY